MLIQRIQGATRVLGAPVNWDEAADGPCFGLPILDIPAAPPTGPDQPGNAAQMASAWEPTPEELAALNAGAPVILFVIGGVHPPVYVGVGEAPA